jgi:hypothetical protein
MEKNIIILVGLPGSGKSRMAKQINLDNNNKYKVIDDPKSLEKDIKPFINQDLIITDPALCFEANREKAKQFFKEFAPNSKIDWIYFENNPEQCLINADIRNRTLRISMKPIRNVDSFIRNLHQFYTIPEGANVVSVWGS